MANYNFKTTQERSDLMKKIGSINTKPEIELRKALWKLGLRYRIHDSKIKGKPDIIFKKSMVVIFVDGEFWHGYNWSVKKNKIKANRKYWIQKIERNIERDKETTNYLQSHGYTVLRFWENEIKKDIPACLKKIIESL